MSVPKTEALAAGAAQCFGDPTNTNKADCARCTAERKGLATLQALWALQGHQLRHVNDGFLLIDPVGRSRSLPSMQAARVALEQIGGTQ